jgi:hypothetical protein
MVRRSTMPRRLELILVIVACTMAAQENGAQEKGAAALERRSENMSTARSAANTEVLVRVDFPGLKNWRGIKSGTVLEGGLALPMYQGTEMVAPKGSQEPTRIEGRMVPAGTIVEGKVARSRPPRMLSRAGKMNLKLERMLVEGTESLYVDGSLSGVESNRRAPFVLDDEGTLRGKKPGIWNGLMDLGYAYVVGKIADDVSEAPIRAIGGVMSDAAVANAARYVGITTGIVFLVTRHGRDVYMPKYAVVEIDFGERKQDEVK